ncbi:hypothetical protein HE1_00434 [Holospora elegans E1]|uniref:Uncharacterized protein n=1 Tax=Holospora elegans E1 TaxID=1427503 RepID=A0A023DXI5_9PROT|nr:hypothetical protein HE1_00434 [Holospora elegans E1]
MLNIKSIAVVQFKWKGFLADHTPPHFFEGALKDPKERLFY